MEFHVCICVCPVNRSNDALFVLLFTCLRCCVAHSLGRHQSVLLWSGSFQRQPFVLALSNSLALRCYNMVFACKQLKCFWLQFTLQKVLFFTYEKRNLSAEAASRDVTCFRLCERRVTDEKLWCTRITIGCIRRHPPVTSSHYDDTDPQRRRRRFGPEIVSNYSCGCFSCSDDTYDVIITDDVNMLEAKRISYNYATSSKFGCDKYS